MLKLFVEQLFPTWRSFEVHKSLKKLRKYLLIVIPGTLNVEHRVEKEPVCFEPIESSAKNTMLINIDVNCKFYAPLISFPP